MKMYTGPKVTFIGKCVYCGAVDDLTDEHILPYALWGEDVLEKASCKACAAITSKYERHVAKELLLPVRAALGYRSRRKKKLPTQFPLNVVGADGQQKTLMLGAQEQSALAIFPEYELPQFLIDGTTRTGIGVNGTRLISFGVDPGTLAQKYGFKELSHTSTFKATRFERFLAKWAYCTAVRRHGLDEWLAVYVIDDILDRSDTIGSFVGCDGQEMIGLQPGAGAYVIAESPQRDVVVRLKLFANAPTPEYVVVVGRLRPTV